VAEALTRVEGKNPDKVPYEMALEREAGYLIGVQVGLRLRA
jgi:hypothetical protein